MSPNASRGDDVEAAGVASAPEPEVPAILEAYETLRELLLELLKLLNHEPDLVLDLTLNLNRRLLLEVSLEVSGSNHCSATMLNPMRVRTARAS